MKELEGLALNETVSTFEFQQIYFLDQFMQNRTESSLEEDAVTDHMHMLKVIYRSEFHRTPTIGSKSFSNSENVKSLRQHVRLKCLKGVPCISVRVNKTIGDMRHYRVNGNNSQIGWEHFTKKTVRDTYIWRYKDKLKSRVRNALTAMGLMSNSWW